MKHIPYSYLLLMIIFTLPGCVPFGSAVSTTQAEIQLPSPTFITPTSTAIPSPTETETITPPATLEPGQAKDTIRTLLRAPMDCESPCLWGIIPGKTTLNEAINIFVHLGLPIKSTTYEGKEFYGTQYEFDSGLSIIVTLTIQDEIVKNFRVDINPETQKVGVPREWLAYSPETLIRQYGLPSKVDFFLGRGPRTSFTMYMYFDAADLIVEYHILDLRARLQVCPLIEQFHYVGIWMGKDPIYIPAADTVPLEKATSMTMEEFTELMIGTPNKACFNVKGEMFP